jgi:hypothetical protein
VLDGWEADGTPRLRDPRTAITLRNLLTHSSGFAYDIWNPDMARYAKALDLPRAGSGRNAALRIPLMFDPGERWEYGIGIDWAGKMIEAVSGVCALASTSGATSPVRSEWTARPSESPPRCARAWRKSTSATMAVGSS